jgi:hypothetical protein
MAIAFNKTNGSAKKGGAKYYEYKMGDNKVRIFGEVLPRYIYWVSGTNGKNVPFECLAFNRDTETFDKAERDYVQEMYPDLRCSWSYAVKCIQDGEVKIMSLKKKLFEQILTAAEDLGDPTDLETGYDICFKKVKTGSMAYNVEYQFQPLKCKPSPVTDEERKLIEESKPIDELLPRESAEDQKKRLDKLMSMVDGEEEKEEEVDSEVADEFDVE